LIFFIHGIGIDPSCRAGERWLLLARLTIKFNRLQEGKNPLFGYLPIFYSLSPTQDPDPMNIRYFPDGYIVLVLSFRFFESFLSNGKGIKFRGLYGSGITQRETAI
jgi:hypothetical protein